jgi:hypothetical protein
MPWTSPVDVHVNTLLTNVGLRWKNPGYIGDSLFPVIPVPNKSDVYAKWGKSAWFRDEARVTAAGTSAPQMGLNVDLTPSYKCLTYKIKSPIPRELASNADAALQLEARTTELLTDKISLAREMRIATALTTYTNWTNYSTLSGTNRWSDYTYSVPVTNIDTAIGAVEDSTAGLRANVMVMGVHVWRALRRHPDILELCFGPGGSGEQIVTEALFARAFELDRVLIGRAMYTSTTETQLDTVAATYIPIWSPATVEYAWIGHVTNAASPIEPTAGYTFREFYQVRSWYDDDTNTDFIEASESSDEVVVAADCGYLFTTPIA